MDLAFAKVPSYDGFNCFLVIVDEFSHFISVIPLKKKSDSFNAFELWHAEMCALTDRKLRFITTDNDCPIAKSVQPELKKMAESTNILPSDLATWFRSLLLRLNDLATTTRPDIQICVKILSRHQHPTVELFEHLLKVLKYLQRTVNTVLQFRKATKPSFETYADASYFKLTGESTIGIAHMANSICFGWVCNKNDRTVSSTNETEFLAVYQASKSVVYYRDLLNDLGLQVELP